MVNGFVNFGALADKNINKITPTIIEMIKDAKKRNFQLVAFKDCHGKDDEEFKTFPPHCLKGTEESELIPEIKQYENQFDYIIGKDTTNGFVTKEFGQILKKQEFKNVIVCGCCTDICVLNFVESYLKYIPENKLSTNIYVIENACYTFEGPNHHATEFHNNAIAKMKEMGAKIASFQDREKEGEL